MKKTARTSNTIISLLAVALAAVMLSGCSGGSANTESKNQTEQPEASAVTDYSGMELIIYNTSKEEEMLILLEKFEKETGIHGETVRLSAGEALGRITVERENPKANVWYGGGIDSHNQAKAEGLLTPYVSPSAGTIPSQYKDSEGYFTGQGLTSLVIGYNKALLEERNVPVPTSWKDLLDPAYEGQITMANPGSSGTAYTFLSTICQLFGEEEGMAYMKELNKNIKSYEKSGSAPARLAAQGEAMIAITYLHDVLSYQEEGFVDLMAVVPEDGTGYEINCVSMIEGGPDQEIAKAFIDFVLRPENQVIADEVGYHVIHTQPDAKNSEKLNSLGEIKLIQYDFEWAGSNRNRLVEEWGAMVGE